MSLARFLSSRDTAVCWPQRPTDLTAFHFSFLFSMKNEFYSTNVVTRDKLLARIFDAFISINKRELQLRRETSNIHT